MRVSIFLIALGLNFLSGCGAGEDKLTEAEKLVRDAGGIIVDGKVDFSKSSIDNDQLGLLVKPLSTLENVTTLVLDKSKVSDGVTEYISKIPWVTAISLSNTSISDKSLEALGKLQHIEQLTLRRTKITDKGIGNLKTIKNLISLDLSYNDLTGEELDSLKNLENLSTLVLRKTSITSEGANKIATLPKIRRLDLSWTALQPKDLTKLADMKSLLVIALMGYDQGIVSQSDLSKTKPKLVIDFGPGRDVLDNNIERKTNVEPTQSKDSLTPHDK